jgi:peptidyl-prolyl cis-trans isomerase SurA
MKQSLFLLSIIIIIAFLQACSTSSSTIEQSSGESSVVANINNQPVYIQELRAGYTGTLDSTSVSSDELRDFLPSYIDYRLKIIEGRKLGYFEDPDILAEYRSFAKEAAQKQWINNDIESRIVDTFIQRIEKEYLAYHILITAQNPGYEESKEIKSRLLQAKEELLSGADPDSVNLKYSSVQNGNPVGGILPWITAGRTVKQFEDELYSLSVGEISDPIQTQFGFHIIYLMDERPRTPERRVSHIFVVKEGNENPDEKIAQALDSLKQGLEWVDVVDQLSDDRRTASRGGEIGWVGYGMQYPESFVDRVMEQSVDSSYSDIIEMDYGFHIVKIDSVRDFTNAEAIESYAKNELNRLGRLEPGNEELYQILAEYGDFQFYEQEFDQVARLLLDETDSLLNNATIAEFNKKSFTSSQFVDFYTQEGGENGLSVSDAFDQYKERIIESELIELTKQRFESYRFEMEQFLQGLVVFKVNEEFLWNPEAADEELLRSQFEQNRPDYKTEETISYYRITATADSAISPARDALLMDGNPEKLNEQFGNIIVSKGSTTNRNPELFQKLKTSEPGEVTELENNDTWHQFYYISGIEPERLKTYEEAKSEVFNQVREQHEQEYLEMLRAKYQTELFPENVQ